MARRPLAAALAAALALIVLQGAAAAGHGAAEARPCGVPAALRDRRLLHVHASAPSPAPGAAPDDGSDGTIINQLLDQKCSMMHRALVSGTVLQLGAGNLQPNEVACCQSCLSRQGCTAWVYCPVAGGCSAEGSRISLVENGTMLAPDGSGTIQVTAPDLQEQRRQLQLPHQGCRLLSIPAFKLRRDSPQILAQGPDVQFVSGTPVSFELPTPAGYSVRTGKETSYGLGYRCPDSLLLYSCLLKGSAEELAAICDADPLCKAFVYLPGGVDSLSEPVGIFKGGANVHSIDISSLLPNPSTATYIKESAVSLSGSMGPVDGGMEEPTAAGGGGTNALWIALPAALAAALVAVAAVAVYASLVMRRQARQLVEAEAAVAKAQSKAQRAGSDRRAPLIGGASTLTVHLLKPSPPGSSSSSGGCCTPRAAVGATSCGSADRGVPCPQCGSLLGVSACRQPRHRQQQQPQQQPQQPLPPPQHHHHHHHQPQPPSQQQQQQVLLAPTTAPLQGTDSGPASA